MAALSLPASVLLLLPIPYIIFGPGAAVDLGRALTVPGHTSPPGRFYLTDVNILPSRPFFYGAAKLLPGFEIIPRQALVPPSVSDKELDRQLVDAMGESQINAQIVAERAAGLNVRAESSFVVLKTVAGSPAARCFRKGDQIVKVNGRALQDAGVLAAVTTSKPAGSAFALTLRRKGRLQTIGCKTFRYRNKPRFGVTGSFQTLAFDLPVHVTYRLPNINGSSAGLMFALQIYRTITGHDVSAGEDVAGTGVLTADGRVTPIEGVREKIQAAIKAHAVTFLVPAENYSQISHTPGIHVIAVKSFHDALSALQKAHVRPSALSL